MAHGKEEAITVSPEEKKIEHKNIYAALSALQGELKPIEQSAEVKFKTRGGDEVNFTYAPLGKIMERLYPLLAKHGLSVRHELTDGVECVLTHETATEETLKVEDRHSTQESTNTKISEVFVPTNALRSGKLAIKLGGDMKETGAQITYAKRYTLGLVLGLSTEEDKDVTIMEANLRSAQGFAYGRAEKSIKEAQTAKQLEENMAFITKDIERIAKKEKTALGLESEQYDKLIELGAKRRAELEKGVGSWNKGEQEAPQETLPSVE